MTDKIDTIYGPISVPDWPDDLIVRTLKAHGEWAYSEQLLLAPLLRAKDNVWDVGAFLGTFGLGLTQTAARKPAKLVSFEPNPVLEPHIRANLERNAPCPVRHAPYGAAGETGRLRPRTGSGTGNAGAIAYEMVSKDVGAEDGDIICKSLQDLRAEFGDYDVLKLDVEGMENDVIRGDIEYIAKRHPVIWAECNEALSSIPLLEALCWASYEPLYVAFPAFRKQNFRKSSETIYPMAYESVLLAAPRDRLDAFVGEVPGEDIIVRPVKTSFDLRSALWSTPRWSLPEWAGLSRPELVALLGRQDRHEDLAGFLNDML